MSLSVRACTEADIPEIVALISDRIGEEDAPEAELVLRDPGFDNNRWSVAVEGDRVVSTMATFPADIRVGECEVPGSMIEFVATNRDFEGRGLVRSQFDYHHADVLRRGELFQYIVGITYFYRKLGYEYALPVGSWREIAAGASHGPPDGWTVRSVGAADLALVMDLQRAMQTTPTLSAGMSADLWSFILRSPVYTTLLAEVDGKSAAMARVYLDDGEPFVMDLAGVDRAGIDAVLAEVSKRAPGQKVTVLDRPATADLLGSLGTVSPSGDAYYARIGDPVGWLNAVRPELNRRLSTSPLSGASGEGLLSLYSSSIRFSYSKGEISAFEPGEREQSPISKGGSGVPPDLVASLLIGPHGFAKLAESHPDVNGGKQPELMSVLFPPQTADVQSWVIP